MFTKLPDDPFITEMDPVQKIWLYEHWLGDHRDTAELTKNHAYLLGSFWNPEAVRDMTNPNVHESSDEELEESWQMVQNFNKREEQAKQALPKRRRQKAKLIQKTP
jgi:hypothetical protein